MNFPFVRLLLASSALIVSTPVHADFTEEGYRQYGAAMLRLFSTGTKPPADSPFIGSWKSKSDPERIYTFLADGTFKTKGREKESSEGKWVHVPPTDDNPVRAAFRIKDHATEVKIKDRKLWVSGGDYWFDLEKIPLVKPAEEKNGK